MKMLRLAEVIEMTGLSRSTIYRYEGNADFPQRRRIGPNAVRWLDLDILEWMQSRPAMNPTGVNSDEVGERAILVRR